MLLGVAVVTHLGAVNKRWTCCLQHRQQGGLQCFPRPLAACLFCIALLLSRLASTTCNQNHTLLGYLDWPYMPGLFDSQ